MSQQYGPPFYYVHSTMRARKHLERLAHQVAVDSVVLGVPPVPLKLRTNSSGPCNVDGCTAPLVLEPLGDSEYRVYHAGAHEAARDYTMDELFVTTFGWTRRLANGAR